MALLNRLTLERHGDKAMPDESRTWLKLTVWRSTTPFGAIVDGREDAGIPPPSELPETQKIFSWSFTEDHWASLPDNTLRREFDDRLAAEFGPALRPEFRSMDKFADFLNDLRPIAHQVRVGSLTLQNKIASLNESHERLDSFLDFFGIMERISEMFGSLPGSSITVT